MTASRARVEPSSILSASPTARPGVAPEGATATAYTPSAPSFPIQRPPPARRKSVVKRPRPPTIAGLAVMARTTRRRAAAATRLSPGLSFATSPA